MNIVLITSVIDTPKLPLSYSPIRSVFSREERFEQTKLTIASVKKYIANSMVVIVECSDLSPDEETYFNMECDHVINLWENKELHKMIFGTSKSLGEGIMTIRALEFISNLGLHYDYLYKVSGRYWLNDNFNLTTIDCCVFKQIHGNKANISTALYKLTKNCTDLLKEFLQKNIPAMEKHIGYEILMGQFIMGKDIKLIDRFGLNGYVTVCGSFYDG